MIKFKIREFKTRKCKARKNKKSDDLLRQNISNAYRRRYITHICYAEI